MKKKGFTLIELLAVIVILAIIALIAIPSITGIIETAKIKAYQANEQAMIEATKNYLDMNKDYFPVEIGDTIEVTLSDLLTNHYISNINDSNGSCNGYVLVTKTEEKNEYIPYLKCGEANEIENSLEDGLVLHYNFDDFQETTENIIPAGAVNAYPQVGNTHGTYNTNQYNNNIFFPIGVIDNITNNVVTLSSVGHPIYTYDVLTPQTSGGGVVAGTSYYIHKISNNSFTLHQYDNNSDGSKGFGVYSSIYNDQRINITLDSFPTMWYGKPHLPNSALVKEIIPNCYNSLSGKLHECIRFHTEHKSEGSVDGMAYGVYPYVIAGETYTFSFYYKAVNEASVGSRVKLGLYTTTSWIGSNVSKSVNSTTEWQRYVLTLQAPATGGTNLYFWTDKGTTIDISEIQVEHKPYATPFTLGIKTGKIQDYSLNQNTTILNLETTPRWISENSNGYYYFDGINDFISLPDDIVSVTDIREKGVTYSTWINTSTLKAQRIIGQQISDQYSDYSSGGLGINAEGYAMMIAYSDFDPASYLYAKSDNKLIANKWYNLVGIYDIVDKKLKLYVNGELSASMPLVGSFSRLYSNQSNAIGGKEHYSSIENYYEGYIDDIKIYNRPISAEEIKYQYEVSKNKYQ